MSGITRSIVADYLNDALPADQAAAVEKAIRADPALQAVVEQVRAEADRGDHTVGGIWRRDRLSCPTRETLGTYLQDVLDPAHAEYVRFHLTDVVCPYCQANLDDLARLHAEPPAARTTRRKRIVDSSAKLLRE